MSEERFNKMDGGLDISCVGNRELITLKYQQNKYIWSKSDDGCK
jgi:hypothetical protein